MLCDINVEFHNDMLFLYYLENPLVLKLKGIAFVCFMFPKWTHWGCCGAQSGVPVRAARWGLSVLRTAQLQGELLGGNTMVPPGAVQCSSPAWITILKVRTCDSLFISAFLCASGFSSLVHLGKHWGSDIGCTIFHQERIKQNQQSLSPVVWILWW